MNKNKLPRRRLVRRYFAERYLLLILLAFAASVSLTRLFLELSGYPQLGTSVLHIAHLLWGGLALFIGGLLPLVFANQRALDISALMSGLGMGLFIDEVGKFITRTNDYFFPAAAPIVYVTFLLTLLMYVLFKPRRAPDQRTRLYHVIEMMEEVLEGDLSEQERGRMLANLDRYVAQTEDNDLNRLENLLADYLESKEESLVLHQPDFLEKMSLWWAKMEGRIFKGRSTPVWLMLGWALWGCVSILRPLLSVYAHSIGFSLPGSWQQLITTSIDSQSGFSPLEWARIAGEILIGIGLLLAVGLAVLKKYRTASSIAYFGLLVMIVSLNILVFYYEQFSAIFFTFFQFLVLIATVRYRWVYARENSGTHPG